MHQPCPHRDDLYRRLQIEDARDGGGDQFADAVSGQRRRADSVCENQPRQRVLDREQSGLGQVGGLQAGAVFAEYLGGQIDAQLRGEAFGTAVEVLPEDRLGVMQTARHADVLGSLPGKQQRDPGRVLRRTRRAVADRDVGVLVGGQHGAGIGAVGDDGGHSDLVRPAARQRERHVGQWQVLVVSECRGERGLALLQRFGGARGQQQHLRAVGRRGGGRRCGGPGRFLDDGVDVSAADTEGADPGSARGVRLPWLVGVGHHERCVLQVQFRIGRGVVHCRGDCVVLQAQDRLDQTGDPGRRIEVADVGFHRAQYARAGAFLVGDLERLSQGFDFDGVAQRGAGAVGLHETDGRGVDVGNGMRLGDDFRLTGDGGSGVSHLHRAVVVDGRAADHRVDPVAVLQRCAQRLEYQRRHPAAEYGAVGVGVERPAVPRRRHHRPGLVGVADAMGHPDRRSAGQCHVAFPGEQALTRQVHRDQ